jgi:hypothetical protein
MKTFQRGGNVMHKAQVIIITSLAFVLLLCGTAGAAWQGYIHYDGTLDPGKPVNITLPSYSGGALIGEIALDLLDDQQNIIAQDVWSFCIEDETAQKGTYPYTFTPVASTVNERYKKAAWIYTSYMTLSFDGNLNLDAKKMGAQAAIWEVMMENENNSYDLSSGEVKVQNTLDIHSSASTIFGGLSTFINNNNGDLGQYDFPGIFIATNNGINGNPGNQDYITAAVPIPGAVWLLGSGLLGLIGVRMTRRG